MDLVLFGIQGCGKGTQAKKFVEEYNVQFFEAGGELRRVAEEDNHLGNQVRTYINAGHLVPHEIIMEIVRNVIQNTPPEPPSLFDGVPRDMQQMQDFDAIMEEAGREFVCVHILLSDEEALDRIHGRAEKEGRVDDADEVKVKRRMHLFHEKTMPVIEDYKAEGKVVEIDGNASVDEVYASMKDALADVSPAEEE